ncbi:MAG: L-aspartate oxidase [Pseudomonadota bacterium]
MAAVETVSCDGALIIGAGVAGLFAALKMAPAPCTVISPEPLGKGASSGWAQGGVAAALGEGDRPAAHAADTIAAGAGLVDPAAAAVTTEAAAARIEDLARLGAPFARDADGAYLLSKEAAHSAARVARFAEGDGAGRAIMATLIEAVRAAPSVTVLPGVTAEELLVQDGRVVGALCRRVDGGGAVRCVAGATLLAAGGLSGLYARTTNPSRIRGQALGMAARAGASVRDVEFVQFHPTAIDAPGDPTPLATEALRGEGAVLVDRAGRRFMVEVHADAELAPRDVVARAVFRQNRSGGGAFLDTRDALGAALEAEFPAVAEACRKAGIDPMQEPIPVTPAAHYHMGGVATDLSGRSDLLGLWVAGEAAATGLHGANRLASNGLLESLVFGARAAADIGDHGRIEIPRLDGRTPASQAVAGLRAPDACITALRETMSAQVGVERDAASLRAALAKFAALEAATAGARGFHNMVAAATLTAAAALRRTESRGGHYRTDFPETDASQAESHSLTWADALEARVAADLVA